LGLCRWLYNTALEQRIIAWQRVRVSVSRFQQEAELKDIRAEMPEYAAIHSHVLQDALARTGRSYSSSIGRDGKRASMCAYPNTSTCSSFLPSRPNCSPPTTSGP